MKNISIIGTGVMGSSIANAYIKAGFHTTIWNRTQSKTKLLVDSGAKLAKTVEDLILAGDIIISALGTYENLLEILDSKKIDWKSKILVNVSSGTVKQARKFGEMANNKKIPYLDSSAMSGVKLVGHKDCLFLFSGDKNDFLKAKPSLEVLGIANYLGADFGLTPIYDTALFTLAWGSLIGFYHASALLQTENQDLEKFAVLATKHTKFITTLFKQHSIEIKNGKYNNDDGNIDIHLSAMEHVQTVSKESNLATDFPSFIINMLSKAQKIGFGDNGIASTVETIKGNYEK
ncbi:NAD(P)-dependent oxidoreductase [Pedobacter frigoris]|uniref:NAD(P)-dependent oxidoreductase n=1 Tax=Pedobacter frigoris TaxID=2571272 RepID=A0A4U1CGG7_9SPHI|nr:NAD(P)-binding domain-containing protein [Pedobacter frigoris]TKC05805.1 NAD(P)-dependent oxidoreductase [Pedobacter frigoris]